MLTGEAEAKKDSTIAEALAEEQRMQAKLVNDTEIARAKRDYELKKAGYDTEVSSQGADLPPPLHVATASKNHLNEKITSLLPSSDIANLGHAALLRRCEGVEGRCVVVENFFKTIVVVFFIYSCYYHLRI
jgi:hypothetical protein